MSLFGGHGGGHGYCGVNNLILFLLLIILVGDCICGPDYGHHGC